MSKRYNARTRRYEEVDDAPPLRPTNASTGGAAVARAQGYSSPHLGMGGEVLDAMNDTTGERENFTGGKSPQSALSAQIRQEATQGTPGTTSTGQPATTGNVTVGIVTPTDALTGGLSSTMRQFVQGTGNGAPATGNAPAAGSKAPTARNFLDTRPTAADYLASRPSVQDRLNSLPNGGPGQPSSAPPTFQMPVTIAAGPGVNPNGGLSHDEAMLLLNARRNNPGAANATGPVGKLFQTSAPQTVGAGESAFLNGKPVAPGNSVTFTGPTAAGAVVQKTPSYDPARYAGGTPAATSSTSTPTASTRAPGAPPSYQVPGMAQSGVYGTALQTIAGGAPAAALPPVGSPDNLANVRPPLTPAGTPSYTPPAGPPEKPSAGYTFDNDLADAVNRSMASNPISQARMNAGSFQPSTMGTATRSLTVTTPPTSDTPAAASTANVSPLKVTTDPNNRNAYIGTPDYRTQRVAPSGLGTNDTPGTITPPASPMTRATAATLNAPMYKVPTEAVPDKVDVDAPTGTGAKVPAVAAQPVPGPKLSGAPSFNPGAVAAKLAVPPVPALDPEELKRRMQGPSFRLPGTMAA